MSETVRYLERLLQEMQEAIVQNDVIKVNELMNAQQTAFSNLRESAQRDHRVKQELQDIGPSLMRQLDFNQTLITQALNVTDTLMHLAYTGKMKGNSKDGSSLYMKNEYHA